MARAPASLTKPIGFALKSLLPIAKRGIVFAGHGVAASYVNRKTEELHIPFDDFKAVVSTLEDLEFDFLGMEDVIRLTRTGARHSRHWAHLTFDDGYQNIFDVAYPYLKQRKIPFTVFVSTHYVETRDRFPTFWLRLAEELGLPLADMFPELELGAEPARELFERGLHFASFAEHERIVRLVKAAIMSVHGKRVVDRYRNDMPIRLEDLKFMAADPMVHIGSHSHHHIIYHPHQDPKVASSNIRESMRLLRKEWKVSSQPTFCYPNGDWARTWVEYNRTLGVPAAFADITGFVDSTIVPELVPRFWLTNGRRVLAVAAMSLVGNKSLYAFGRKPPPRLDSERPGVSRRRSQSPRTR